MWKTVPGKRCFPVWKWREIGSMEQEMEIIQGTISAIVYQNYENGYAVLRINCMTLEVSTLFLTAASNSAS